MKNDRGSTASGNGASGRDEQSPAAHSSAAPHEIGRRDKSFVSIDPTLLDLPLIHDFLSNRSYWAAGIPMEVVRRSVENSLCFGLYQGANQIGFARVVTDHATFAYLADVFVLEAHRGQGLSKLLLDCVMRHAPLQGLRRFLLGTLDAHGLYERLGFTPLSNPERFLEIFRPNVYGVAAD